MNRIIICILLALWGYIFSFGVKAQDKIVTNDDKIIVGFNLEIGKNAIFYTDGEDANSNLHRIDISNIMLIKRADGSIYDPSDKSDEPAASLPVQSSMQDNSLIELSQTAKISNEKYMAIINTKYEYQDNIDLKADKKSKLGILQYGVTDNSIVKTDELTLTFGLETFKTGPKISVYATNNTDQIVYIDLGNTFVNGECLYVPTATQVSNSSSSGGNLNLGAVANALGVGGTAGALASGINIGGGKGNTVSEIQYSQRIKAIPPHNTIQVADHKDFINQRGKLDGLFIAAIEIDEPKRNQGEIKDFAFDSNNTATLFLTYTKSEDLTGSTGKMSATFYPIRLLYTPKPKDGRPDGLIKNNTNNELWIWAKTIGK